MRHIIRAGLGVAAALAALGLSSSALAAINPRLDVGTGAQAKLLTIGARVGQSDDWIGRLQVYVPTGYKLSLPATGSIAVQAIETQIGPSNIGKLTGTLQAAPAGDATVAWASANCDTGTHAAVSSVTLLGGDNSWIVPVFIDNTTGAETQFGSQKLVVCFGPRGPGASNSMANKLLSLSMTLNGVTAPTTVADYTWRSLWTPFTGAQGNQGPVAGDTLDQNASVEAQSIVHIAAGVLTIGANQVGAMFLLTGKLGFFGGAMDRFTLMLTHGTTKTRLITLGSAKTTAAGVYSLRTPLKNFRYFQAGATTGGGDLGAAGCKASFGVPCLSATSGGLALASRILYVK
jgi:hypothetical protein